MERNKKRKREVDNPRITYHALTKTFDRLFKEESLAEMKEVARRKLGLSSTMPVGLAQIRDGKIIDLDDDDDFDAFFAVAHSASLVNVQVTVESEAIVSEPDIPLRKKKRKKSTSAVVSPDNVPEFEATEQVVRRATGVAPSKKHAILFAGSTTGDVEVSESIGAPPKKKRKRKTSMIADSIETHPQETTDSHTIDTLSVKASGSGITSLPTGGCEEDGTVTTPGQERGAGESKNARRRKQKLQQQQQSPVVYKANTSLGTQNIATRDESPKSHPMGEPSKVKEIPFAEQLAGAISQTNEMNQRRSEVNSVTGISRSSTRAKGKMDPQPVATSSAAGKGKRHFKDRPIQAAANEKEQETPNTAHSAETASDSNDSNSATQRLKAKARMSKADELEAANADVKAAVSRILAAKRASLAGAPAQVSPTEGASTNARLRVRMGPEANSAENGPPATGPSTNITRESGPPHVATPENPLTTGDTPLPQSQVPSSWQEARSNVILERPFPPALSSNVVDQRSASDSNSSDSESNTSVSDNNTSDIYRPVIQAVSEDVYADVDLEALVRGPKVPLTIAEFPGSSDEEEIEQLELEEDEQEEQSSRRSKRQEMDSSDDETDVDIDEDSPIGTIIGGNQPPSVMEIQPPLPREGSTSVTSFQAVDRLGFFQDIDDSSNAAFEQALEEATAVFQLANEATHSPDVVRHAELKNPTTSEIINPASVAQESTYETLLGHTLTTANFNRTSSIKVTEKMPDGHLTHEIEVQDTPRRNGVIQKMRGRGGKAVRGKINFLTPSNSQRGGNEEHGSQDSIARRTRSTMSLGLMTPPPQTLGSDDRHTNRTTAFLPPSKRRVQQTKIGDISATISAPSREEALTKVSLETQPSSEKSMSPDTWATLKPSSPLPDDSVTMIDELESSSPTAFNRHSPPKEPLFILTESQAPFPYSQWTGTAPEEDNQVVSNDSDDEEEVIASVQSQLRVKSASKYSSYRTLTDIASQQSLFATPPNLQSTQPHVAKHKLADLYGSRPRGEEGISESNTDPDSDSESDVETIQEKTHFPEARRAGVIQKRK